MLLFDFVFMKKNDKDFTCSFGLAHVRAGAGTRLLVDSQIAQSGAELTARQWVGDPVPIN